MKMVLSTPTQGNRLVKMFSTLLVSLFLMLGATSPALADDPLTYPTEFIAKNDPVVAGIVKYVNDRSPVSVLGYQPDTGIVSFNTPRYNKLSESDKRDYMEIALGQIKSSNLGVQPKNKLYNFVYNVDHQIAKAVDSLSISASADLATGASWLNPFSGVISGILGLISFLIFFGIAFTLLFDLAYIALPFIQGFAAGQDGKGSRFISSEARKAVMEEERSGKNAVGLWLRTKLVKIVLVSIVLMYFILGRFYPAIAQLMSAVGMN